MWTLALRDTGNGLLAERNRAVVAVPLDVGLRASDVTGICMEDLDVMSGDLYIPPGKGDKPRQLRLEM